MIASTSAAAIDYVTIGVLGLMAGATVRMVRETNRARRALEALNRGLDNETARQREIRRRLEAQSDYDAEIRKGGES